MVKAAMRALEAGDVTLILLVVYFLSGVMALLAEALHTLSGIIERVMGLGYMTAQAQIRFWFTILAVLGVVLLGGVLLAVLDLLTLRPAPWRKRGEASGEVPVLPGFALSCSQRTG